jgi:hypothetical protein
MRKVSQWSSLSWKTAEGRGLKRVRVREQAEWMIFTVKQLRQPQQGWIGFSDLNETFVGHSGFTDFILHNVFMAISRLAKVVLVKFST